MTRLPRRLAAPRRPGGVLLAAFAGFFLLFAVWSVATPLFAAPDEPVQMIKAVAVAHGQLLGTQPYGSGSAYTVVSVPEVYAEAGTIPSCFAFKNLHSADCARPLTGSSADVSVRIYTGRYPPLYYAIVGLPSLLMSSASGVYAMRLVSAALNAVFLALAVTAVVAWSRSRLLLAGLAVAVTPAALFFGGVINPSGFEVCAAICLWCSALVLALERSADPPRGLVALVAVSAAAMALVRGLSPLWVALIGASVLVLAGWRASVELARRRSVQIAAAVVVLAGLVAVAWILHAHTLDVLPSVDKAPAGDGTGQLLLITFEHSSRFLSEMIGQFGWLDTPAPAATYLAWYAVAGLVVLAAFATARLRQAAGLALVTAVAILVPVAISASQAHREGYVWQGKDSLPFAVGVPLVAAELLGLSKVFEERRARLTGTVAFVLAGASVFAFAGTMRRYAVGLQGPVDFLSARWHPPFGDVLWLLVELVAALATAALLAGLTAPRAPAAAPAHAARPHPPDAKDLDRAPSAATVDSGPASGQERREGERGG